MSNNARAALAVAVLIILTYLAVRFMLPLFTPFVIGAFFAAMIEPAVDFIERRIKAPRGVAVMAVLVALGLTLGVLIWVGVAEIAVEVDRLSTNLDALDKSFSMIVDDVISAVTRFFESLPAPIASAIRANEGKAVDVLKSILAALTGFLGKLPQFTLGLVLSVISTFFISRDHALMLDAIMKIMPRSWRRRLRKIRGQLLTGFVGYIRARMVLFAITTVMSLLGLSVLGVTYAWLLALAAGILDIIPIVGPSAMFLPWAFYHVLVGNVGLAIGLVAVLSITSLVRQIAEARVMGKNLDLHPLVALISVYAGVKLFGAIGFIAGPLALIFIKAMYYSVIVPMFPYEEE